MKRSPCYECEHKYQNKDSYPDCIGCLKPLEYDLRFRAQSDTVPLCMTDCGRTLTPGKRPKPIIPKPRRDNKIQRLIKKESKRVVKELMPRGDADKIVSEILEKHDITLESLQKKRLGRPSDKITDVRAEIVFTLHKRVRQKTIGEICGIGSPAVYNIRKR